MSDIQRQMLRDIVSQYEDGPYAEELIDQLLRQMASWAEEAYTIGKAEGIEQVYEEIGSVGEALKAFKNGAIIAPVAEGNSGPGDPNLRDGI